MGWVASLAAALAAIGGALVLVATIETWRLGARARAPHPQRPPVPVTILKPLHGSEPRLAENLRGFAEQGWPAPVQIVAGVQRSDDPAIAAARALGPAVDLVCDSRRHGANAKMSNVINMMTAARHDIIVLSDSDIAVPPDYLVRVVSALAMPGVGAVTCAYVGRGDAGPWSRFGAAMLSYHFLPSVAFSLRVGVGDVCMGSTIALRRETLAAIGGFERFADVLADDHAIGAAVRTLGLRVAVAPVIVTHACTETSLRALFRHELRWSATVRDLRPAGHVGALMLHPLPLAVAAFALAPGAATAVLVAATIGIRIASARVIDRIAGVPTIPFWLLPLRDMMSFGVHLASLSVRTVDWRGARLDMRPEGRIEPRPQ